MPGSLRIGKIAGINISLHVSWLIIFGGVSNIEQEPKSPGVEFQMAFLGPLTSLLLGGLSYLLLLATRGGTSSLAAVLGTFAFLNTLLGLFNLVPAFPLDDGRVLRSIVWKLSGSLRTATRAATVSGQVIAYLFILAGFRLIFGGDILDGIWLGLIGWFLLSGAQSANSQAMLETMFKGVTVGRVMHLVEEAETHKSPVQKFADRFSAFFLPCVLILAALT